MIAARRFGFSFLPLIAGVGAIAIAAVSACTAGTSGDGFEASSSTAGGATGEGGSGTTDAVTTTSTSGFETTTASTGSAGQPCLSGPNTDLDMDGYTPSQGDCNDCDANVNPGAIEVVGTEGEGGGGGAGPYVPVDEDCDGTADNPPPATCDDALTLTSSDAFDAARAIEICKSAADGKWGLVSAQWVRANGTVTAHSNQYGILPDFGANVANRVGENMFAMSSGRARRPTDPEACSSTGCAGKGAGSPPLGFPQTVQGCTTGSSINDDVALEVTLRAPSNATGYKFDFAFYSHEYPDFVCTQWNDQFIALVNPAPQGAINGNICFDSQSNPVSVNIALFSQCAAPISECPTCCSDGAGALAGTGFQNGGATGWLQTSAPVEPGQTFAIRFAIWDTGDTIYDSTVLIDGFSWIANTGVEVGTAPVPQ